MAVVAARCPPADSPYAAILSDRCSTELRALAPNRGLGILRRFEWRYVRPIRQAILDRNTHHSQRGEITRLPERPLRRAPAPAPAVKHHHSVARLCEVYVRWFEHVELQILVADLFIDKCICF